MRIAIVTDAWLPQVNGVVRTLQALTSSLTAKGDEILIIAPHEFTSIPCPSYPEIRLALLPNKGIKQKLDAFRAEAIHIATEGPLGLAARKYCIKNKLRFTTAYHTRFPEYVHARTRIPLSWSYAWIRRFHNASNCVMTATDSLRKDLTKRGMKNLGVWTRGIDTELFQPKHEDFLDLPRPIAMYVGRVAIEKNIEAYLELDIPGSKVVIGDGPQLAKFKRKYPDVHFLGKKEGSELARHYATADVFVFPSLTDTFGLVLLEALACGVPVAAYPVCGPLDVIGNAPVGSLNSDLKKAITTALTCNRALCREYAMSYSWEASVNQFRNNLTKAA